MIFFYNKNTGEIIGTIDGRIHTEDQLKMWVGSQEENDCIVVQWKPVKEYKNEKGETVAWDYAPNHPQADLMFNLDKTPSDVYKYKVNLQTKLLAIK